MSEQQTLLNRTISLSQLLFYGIGTIVGGGIYALTGKVAGEAGMLAPAAFLLAGVLALINAATYAELCSRMPYSAGEAHYVGEAFSRVWLSSLVGWLVIATGVVSAGTLSVATVGFIGDLVDFPQFAGIAALVLALGLVAAWGIGQSVVLVMLITLIEVLALVYILVAADDSFASLTGRWQELVPGLSTMHLAGWISGAFLAFYAFIGFEDMVNVGEEVKNPRTNLPLGIFLSLVISLALYVAVVTVAVLKVAPEELAVASTPLAAVLGGSEGLSGKLMVVVSILTGINGALVQIIMASRVAYGMAKSSGAPAWFSAVHARTRTPLRATALATGIVLLLSLFFPLVTLAKITSTLILAVFALLNVALWRIKQRGDPLPEGARSVPRFLPVLGFLACLALLIFQARSLIGIMIAAQM